MLTVFIIKVRTQQMAGIVLLEHIEAYHILTIDILPLQMLVNIIISKWRKLAIRTFGTFIPLLIAKLPVPLVYTYRLIPGFTCSLAKPPSCKHILTPFEQVPKQFNPFFN